MARADGTDKGVESGSGASAGGSDSTSVSDARLTELLRSDTASAFQGLQELRARHRPAVLAYARLCTAGEAAAGQLAAQAFTLAARETARGIDPGVPWRLQLLLLTGRLAASWATDERAGGLDAGLLLVLNTAGPGGPVPPMLAAFQTLPSRTQGLVWYRIVEQQPVAATAEFLGVTPEDVAYGTDSALQQLGQACLRTRLAASDDPQCGDFRRLIEESVRPDSPRNSTDLYAHMAHCTHCTAAHEELSALRDSPRTALTEGLLPWASTAYVTSEAPRRPKPLVDTTGWPPSRRFLIATVALGVALAPLLVFLLAQGGGSPSSASQQAAGAVGTPTTAPEVTVTATVSTSPSPSATAKSPSPTKSSSPSKPASKSPSPSHAPTHAPNGTYAQVVNVGTGFCLDIRDGDLENGTDVVTAPCSSSRTQRWRVDSARGVVQSSADPDFCLDSRGDVDKGVGIWDCGSVDGDHGQNLSFTVDTDGVIRPAIAIETALTPFDGDGVSLRPLSGGGMQRWRAGAS
ncbi:RICIN domain-containing protein [Streptomyces sp. NBC_01613]|uniref:ricin-type beta-trefoil lectin domain protein n=1 Tax=Streptomyces sp. NBC_01613 TaxID=2975896 RepID=UPI00386F2C9E